MGENDNKKLCDYHQGLVDKMEVLIKGLTALESTLPVHLKSISDSLREMRTSLIDKTELLFKYDKEKQDALCDLLTRVKLLENEKMPPRLRVLENWYWKCVGAFAAVAIVFDTIIAIWKVL